MSVDDLNVCWHESAHATTARLLNIGVVRAVAAGDDPHVRTRYRLSPESLEALAVVDLAATIMEPSEKAVALDERNAFEHCQVLAMDARNFGEDFDGLYEAAAEIRDRLRGEARKLVTEHLNEIGAVAIALQKHGTLDQAAIDAVIGAVRR